jgi:hypothetical protein
LHFVVARGVEIFVVDSEKKGVGGGKGKGQSFQGKDDFGRHVSGEGGAALLHQHFCTMILRTNNQKNQ